MKPLKKELKMYTFREFYIPERMMDELERWVLYGIQPGGFLTAVLENNLRSACEQADDENLHNLPAYVAYLYNNVPADCWGSNEKMKAWHVNLNPPHNLTNQPVTNDVAGSST